MAAPAATHEEILSRLHSLEPEARKRGVRQLAVSGSFATGSAHFRSDVDVLAECDSGRRSYDAFLELCDLLERALGRPVDLVTFEGLSRYIGLHILVEAQDVIRAAWLSS